MYQGRIEELALREAFPRKRALSSGLFAWGKPRLGVRRQASGWVEFLAIFFVLPVLGIFGDAVNSLPVITTLIFGFSVLLLSMTRSFHWGDLLPVDVFSEWRLFVGVSLGFAAASFLVTVTLFPGMLFSASGHVILMLVAFPLLTALPIEIVCRALFFRRFGYLFQSERSAIICGACASALIYLMISESISGACFGFVVGLVLGWTYLRTGQFILNVALHWVASLCIWLIGPGLLIF